MPNTGKSEWLDALMINMMLSQGWRFTVCSMENEPQLHVIKLLEKLLAVPLLSSMGTDPEHQMQQLAMLEEIKAPLAQGYSFLSEHLNVIKRTDTVLPSVEWVLEQAERAVKMYGMQGLIVDPYNRLE